MMLDGAIDLFTADQHVMRAQRSLEQSRALFGTKAGREEARLRDPFVGVRDVAGQTAFKALREHDAGAAQALHKDALLRWIHELLQARVAWELSVDEADAVHAPDPSLASRAAKERAITSTPSGPLPGAAPDLGAALVTFDAARRALAEAPAPEAAEIALRRLEALAGPVVAVRKEIRARRFEAARRLGLEHPWALATAESNGIGKLEALARAVLDMTDPLAAELHKDLRRRGGFGSIDPSRTIHEAFARDAGEGWPARLNTRWLEDVFRAIAPRPPRVAELPAALGGASFLRAAARWGFALRLGGVARALPFALARDPYAVDAHLFGGALAVGVAGRVFAKRKLGLPSRPADAHARALARTLLFTLRTEAAQLVAALPESARDDELEELTARVFGAPLPRATAALWAFGGFSGNARVDAPARLVAAVRTHEFVGGLVERYDDDWFDNPRAGAHLASIAAGPVWQGDVPALDAVGPIARSFEELLG